ncbi:MAG: hypothetical protein IJI97_06725 [Clostridia bacterium]|nr:hypothetical protein [Clostridia bacterium]
MVIHEVPPFASSMLSRITTACCDLPVKQLPPEHGVSVEKNASTCDGTAPRRRTAFGDSTGADDTDRTDATVTDRYGRHLLVEDSLAHEGGALILTSGDGVHLTREQVLDLAQILIKNFT